MAVSFSDQANVVGRGGGVSKEFLGKIGDAPRKIHLILSLEFYLGSMVEAIHCPPVSLFLFLVIEF